MPVKIYAGIGSRETPPEMCRSMCLIAQQLREDGWLLRSGHARGADNAFEQGAAPDMEIHLPWSGYNGGRPTTDRSFIVPKASPRVCEIAARFHPRWNYLSQEVQLFMCRNTTIVLGEDLESPVTMVVCWTPGARLQGGTAHAMKIADAFDIPIFNLADPRDQLRLCEFTKTFSL